MEDGFTSLPTHYDFQYHSDSRSFYSYKYDYNVVEQPIRDGLYVIAVYNYNGRGIENPCNIDLSTSACYSGACETNASLNMQQTSGWFFGIFVLAGLPLFCFIPFFFCIRRLRMHQREGDRRRLGMREVAMGRMRGRVRAAVAAGRPGLTEEEVNTLDAFVYAEADAAAAGDGPDSCAVCLGEFQLGEDMRRLYCRHVFHKACIDEWLQLQRVCPLCKADALNRDGNPQPVAPGTPPGPLPHTRLPTQLHLEGCCGDQSLAATKALADRRWPCCWHRHRRGGCRCRAVG